MRSDCPHVILEAPEGRSVVFLKLLFKIFLGLLCHQTSLRRQYDPSRFFLANGFSKLSFGFSAVDTIGVPPDPVSVCRVTGRLGDKGGTVQCTGLGQLTVECTVCIGLRHMTLQCTVYSVHCTGLGQLTVQLYNPGQVYKGSRESWTHGIKRFLR